MNIILLGPPGSGKGTQAELLSKEYSIPHISMGELLKKEYAEKTVEGVQAYKHWIKGNLAPDELVLKILKRRMDKEDCTDGFILDGYPRNEEQEKVLNNITTPDKAVYLDVPDKIIIDRMSQRTSCPKGHSYGIGRKPKKAGICDIDGEKLKAREDDKPEIIKQRLKVFHEQTKPLLQVYKKKGILKKVNGAGSVQEIFQRLKEDL